MPSRLGGSEILMTEAELRAKIRELMPRAPCRVTLL